MVVSLLAYEYDPDSIPLLLSLHFFSYINLVRDLGGTVREDGDDLYIIGSGILKGGQGDCVNDHRLVMAGTLMALISESPVTLKDSEAITKSYPDFFEDWNLLGGNAQPV